MPYRETSVEARFLTGDLEGPVPLWVLAAPLRGDAPVSTFVVGPERDHIFIAVRPVLAPAMATVLAPGNYDFLALPDAAPLLRITFKVSAAQPNTRTGS